MSATPNSGLAKVMQEFGRGSPTQVIPKPFDLAAIKPLHGEMDGSGKFSPNLYLWMRNRWAVRSGGQGLGQPPSVYRDVDAALWIGRMGDDGWFSGARLMSVLTKGRRQEIYARPPRSAEKLKPLSNFWRAYIRLGRCAIDKAHNGFWLYAGSRWDVKGKARSCRWCGNHQQKLRVRTEVVRTVVKTWVKA